MAKVPKDILENDGPVELAKNPMIRRLEQAFIAGANDTEACFIAGLPVSFLKNHEKDNPDFVERKHALQNMTKFRAKALVAKAIEKERKTEVAQWYLERKGKDEGFSTRQELTGPNGKDLVPPEAVQARLNNLKASL